MRKSDKERALQFSRKNSANGDVPVWPEIRMRRGGWVTYVRIKHRGMWFLVEVSRSVPETPSGVFEALEILRHDAYNTQLLYIIDLKLPFLEGAVRKVPNAYFDFYQDEETARLVHKYDLK